MTRLFVAVNFPAAINAAIAKVLPPSGAGVESISWVAPENFHLTVKFIGQVDESLISRIEAELRACARHLPVEIGARGTGQFPAGRPPRVLWIGVHDPSGGLARLAAEIDLRLGALGIARETRVFSPHLTIGRVKDGRPDVSFLRKYDEADFGHCTVTEMILYRSDTLPSGPRYTPLAVIGLS